MNRHNQSASPRGQESQSREKGAQARKAAGKAKTERVKQESRVIALMKRAKGATLAEIMATTGWQVHNVHGFVSVHGSKAGEEIQTSKNGPESAPTASPSG